MILLFPPLQSPWPTRACSPSPTGLVRQNGEEKMKSEMLGVNLRQLLEKKKSSPLQITMRLAIGTGVNFFCCLLYRRHLLRKDCFSEDLTPCGHG